MFLQSIILTIVATETIQTVELGKDRRLVIHHSHHTLTSSGLYKSYSAYTTGELHVSNEHHAEHHHHHHYPLIIVPKNAKKAPLVDGLIFVLGDDEDDEEDDEKEEFKVVKYRSGSSSSSATAVVTHTLSDAIKTGLKSYPNLIQHFDTAKNEVDLRHWMAQTLVNKPNRLPLIIVNDRAHCIIGQMISYLFRDYFHLAWVNDHEQLVRAVGPNYTDQYAFIAIAGESGPLGALVSFLIVVLSSCQNADESEPSETDYEKNQIQFHAVPYTGPADDIGRLINFLMATYQQYGALMPENVKRKD